MDTFEKTLPMSTCNLGFMITQINKFNNCKQKLNDTIPRIYLWTYRDVADIMQVFH